MFEKLKKILAMVKRDRAASKKGDPLSARSVENVADLNDRFSRARQQGKEEDGKFSGHGGSF